MTAAFAARRETALAFLHGHATDTTPHLFGDLQSHLEGVEALVRAWGGPDLLCLAALGHATYGTDGFAPFLVGVDQRDALSDAIGPEAEALVYFYASCDRGVFYPQLQDAATRLKDLRFVDRFNGAEFRPKAEDVARFVDLTYANEVELAASSPGGAAEWTWLVDFCRGTQRWATPSFFDGAMAVLGAAA